MPFARLPTVDAAYSAAFLTAAVGMALESGDLPEEDPGITVTRCVGAMVLDACIYEQPAAGAALADALVAALLALQSGLHHDLQKRDKAGWTAAAGIADALQRGGAVDPDKTQALTAGADLIGDKRLQFFRACALVRCLPHQFLATPRSLALREQLQQCGLLLVAIQLRYSTREEAFAQVCKLLAALTQALTRVLRGTALDAAPSVAKQTADVRWVLSGLQTALQLVGGHSDAGAASLFLDSVANASAWVAELLVSTAPELGSQVFVDLAAFLSDGRQLGTDPSADNLRALCRACVGHHVLGALSASGLPAPVRTLQALHQQAVRVLSLAGSGTDGQSHALLEHSCGVLAATVEMCQPESTTDESVVAALGLAIKCLMGGGGRHTVRALCASLRALHARGCLTATMCENALHAMVHALTGTQREHQPATKAAVLDATATLVDLADSSTRSSMVEFLLTSSDDALVAGTGAAGPLQLLRVLLTVQCRSHDAGSSGGTDYGDSCAAMAIRALDGLAFEGSGVEHIDAQATAAVRSHYMCERASPHCANRVFLLCLFSLASSRSSSALAASSSCAALALRRR